MAKNRQNRYLYIGVIGAFLLDDELKVIKKIEATGSELPSIGKLRLLLQEVEANPDIERIVFLGSKSENPDFSDFSKVRFAIGTFKAENDDKTGLMTDSMAEAMQYFKSPQYFEQYRAKNLKITKALISQSVGNDNLIIQAVSSVDETAVIINTLAKRLREWYGLHIPEFVRKSEDHISFAQAIISKSSEDIRKEISTPKTESMGADLSADSINSIRMLAQEIVSLNEYRQKQSIYLETEMEKTCPNLRAVAGAVLGAKLLSLAGSLQKMASMPASTIQLLGAEKALFRHIKTGAKCPKHGIILEHPLVAKAKRDEHGKAARALADKIALAVKIDYFKGEFIGDKLVEELEKKFKV